MNEPGSDALTAATFGIRPIDGPVPSAEGLFGGGGVGSERALPTVRHVSALDLESLPSRSVSHLFLELVQDGLGRSTRLPVMVARGKREGPVFGLTCAVHGNEINGIPVIHRLFEQLDLRQLRGTVVAVAVTNVPAYLAATRRFDDGTDLNHIFPGSPTGSVGEVYAHRLLERVIKQFDYLVDLHTASTGRVNSLYVRADMTDAATAQMAYLQRPQLIVHNTASDSTLRGAAHELGIPAITVEIGDPQRFQTNYIKSTLVGLRSILGVVGMLPKRQVAPRPTPVVCHRSYWMYSDHGGLLEVYPRLTERVEAGQVVARLSNIFGQVLREYRAPEAGVVVGRSVNPVGPTGARILHLGLEAGEDHPFHLRADQAAAEAEDAAVEGADEADGGPDGDGGDLGTGAVPGRG